MTTDNRTNEQIVARAMSGGNSAYSTHDIQVVAAVAALRAAGRLVEPPTDREKLFEEAERLIDARGEDRSDSRIIRRLITLTAAGVASQGFGESVTVAASPKSGKDREKLIAEAKAQAMFMWPSYPSAGFSGADDRQQAFIDGALYAFDALNGELS